MGVMWGRELEGTRHDDGERGDDIVDGDEVTDCAADRLGADGDLGRGADPLGGPELEQAKGDVADGVRPRVRPRPRRAGYR